MGNGASRVPLASATVRVRLRQSGVQVPNRWNAGVVTVVADTYGYGVQSVCMCGEGVCIAVRVGVDSKGVYMREPQVRRGGSGSLCIKAGPVQSCADRDGQERPPTRKERPGCPHLGQHPCSSSSP